MTDRAYVKLQDPFKSSKNSKQKSFRLENLGFLISRNSIFFKEPWAVFQGWVRDGAGFKILLTPGSEVGVGFWISLTPGSVLRVGAFVNWKPKVIYPYTRPTNPKKTHRSH